jgi:hypothetical protein
VNWNHCGTLSHFYSVAPPKISNITASFSLPEIRTLNSILDRRNQVLEAQFVPENQDVYTLQGILFIDQCIAMVTTCLPLEIMF